MSRLACTILTLTYTNCHTYFNLNQQRFNTYHAHFNLANFTLL